MSKLVLLGAGGHCKSVIDSIDRSKYEIVGILDKKEMIGHIINGIKVIGEDNMARSLINNGVVSAFITVGSIGNVEVRKDLYLYLKGLGYNLPNIIDKSAIIAQDLIIGEGNYIGKRAIINVSNKLGNMCIVNTGAIAEHDCNLGDFVHLAPASVLSGGVSIGNDTHIGTGTVIIQNVRVGCNVLVGAGSVVVKDIEDSETGFGNPYKAKL